MSWSFNAVGKPLAVLKAAKDQFMQYSCAEPEETIREKFFEILEISLDSYPESSAVQVSASGSQSPAVTSETDRPRFYNSIKVDVQPLWGFIE
jgi:hypothetical protein